MKSHRFNILCSIPFVRTFFGLEEAAEPAVRELGFHTRVNCEMAPNATYKELKEQYPDVDDATIKSVVNNAADASGIATKVQ